MPETPIVITKIESGLLKGIGGISFISKSVKFETYANTSVKNTVSIYKNIHIIPH